MRQGWTARGAMIVLLGLSGGVGVPEVSGSADVSEEFLNPVRFTFARVQFNSAFRGRMPGWAHDYPRAERNLLKILEEVTGIETEPVAYEVVRLDDPRIMNYPFLYFSEPGEWQITPEEAENFREYLLRGGFAMFDDFDGPRDWAVFSHCMKQVFPERSLVELQVGHPIFHCLFDIETLDMIPPYNVRGIPRFYGLMDDTGRLQVIVNFNNDIGDFWEWSDQAFYPVDLSNEAYKFGVNYIIYALTH